MRDTAFVGCLLYTPLNCFRLYNTKYYTPNSEYIVFETVALLNSSSKIYSTPTGPSPSTALSKLQCRSTLHYPTTNPPNPHDPWLKQLDLRASVLARNALQELCNPPMPEAQVTELQALSIQTPPAPAPLQQRPNLLANRVSYHHSIHRQLRRRQTTHQQDCSDPDMFHLSVLTSKRHLPTIRDIQR